jgi:hypothetical protein
MTILMSSVVLCSGCGGSSPTLLVGSTIGATGGTVASTDGIARAVFPSNAFDSNSVVSIAPTTNIPSSPRLIAGTAYDFTSSSALSQPAQITIKYDPSRLPTGALETQLVLYKTANGAWQPVPGSTVNTATKTIQASLSQFSTYAVLADNQFSGSYSGTYNGNQSGSWSATVDSDGLISATATGGFQGSGTVSFTGATTIPLLGTGTADGFRIVFNGNFSLQSDGVVVGSGNWTSTSGYTGTWLGSRSR